MTTLRSANLHAVTGGRLVDFVESYIQEVKLPSVDSTSSPPGIIPTCKA
jgi:hypothetical protein